jgi:DNA-binding CsgD family transcriptional regulator
MRAHARARAHASARFPALSCDARPPRGGTRVALTNRMEETRVFSVFLTEREREVLARARDGHTYKEIAYDLGIAASTVRVLVHRAAARLGVTCREARRTA